MAILRLPYAALSRDSNQQYCLSWRNDSKPRDQHLGVL